LTTFAFRDIMLVKRECRGADMAAQRLPFPNFSGAAISPVACFLRVGEYAVQSRGPIEQAIKEHQR
jgi:hypothetical protein